MRQTTVEVTERRAPDPYEWRDPWADVPVGTTIRVKFPSDFRFVDRNRLVKRRSLWARFTEWLGALP